MKKILENYPALRILILVLSGILCSALFIFDISSFIIVSISILILAVICFFNRFFFTVHTLLSIGIGFALGFQIQQQELIFPPKILPEMKAMFKGKVLKVISKNDKTVRIICKGDLDAQHWENIPDTKILITVFRSPKELELQRGKAILCYVKLKFPQQSKFENSFDEKKYLKAIDVKFSAVANSKEISLVSNPDFFDTFINNITTSIENKISLLFTDKSKAIIKAILLGNRSELSAEQKQVFSYSGTAHLLAVSGLHTGIIAGIIFVLIGLISNRYVKLLLFSIAIMLFVILSGTQDSALRAALLSIAVLIAYTFQKRYNLINLLSFVILIVILFVPSIIYSTGFQMSVISVFGILIFYKPIRNFINQFIKTDNYLILFIINSISVTISASIAISPLIAYYFNIFSVVSPLANLLVIPLFTLTLIFSILAVIISFFAFPIAGYYATSSDFLIKLSDQITNISISLPFAYMNTEIVFPVSILISTIVLYLIFSYQLKTFVFRFVICCLVFIGFIYIYPKKVEDRITLYPSNQFTTLIMPLKYNNTFVLIADRKPSQSPKRDLELEKYLLGLNRKLIIGYSGNSGIKLADELKLYTNIKEKEINIKQIRFLKEKLNLPEHLPQIIEY